MINNNLFFKYDLNYLEIIDLALDNNDKFIEVIPEIVFYEKGIWNNNKRKDKIKINITDIPSDISNIIDMIKDKDGLIGIKIKILKEITNDNFIIKTKIKLNCGIIGSLINKTITLKSKLVFSNINDKKTEIDVNYTINSIFFDNLLNNRINQHVQHKLESYYIKNIDKYFLELKK
jgi:hypothetical protein